MKSCDYHKCLCSFCKKAENCIHGCQSCASYKETIGITYCTSFVVSGSKISDIIYNVTKNDNKSSSESNAMVVYNQNENYDRALSKLFEDFTCQ